MGKELLIQTIVFACAFLPLCCHRMFFITLALLGHMLFGKKNGVDLDKEPDCLNDPKYGKHDYLELKSRDGLKIHYVANGDRSKPLMLFLHGFPQFWYTWKKQLEEFGKDYHAVAIDLPGYGYSDKPTYRKRYLADEISQDVKAFIQELGYESCVLVGHDWGAIIAFHTAIEYPEVVSKLITMNVPHKKAFMDSPTVAQFFRSSYIFFFQLPWVPEFYLSALDYFLLQRIYTSGTNPEYYTEEEVNAYKYIFHKGGFTNPLNYYRNLMMPTRKGTGNVEMPSILIWGTEDTALGIELAAASDKYLVNGKVVYVDGISHFVHTDAPHQVHKLMKEFLDGTNQN